MEKCPGKLVTVEVHSYLILFPGQSFAFSWTFSQMFMGENMLKHFSVFLMKLLVNIWENHGGKK